MEFRCLTTTDYDAYYSLRLQSLQECPQMYATDANDWQTAPRPVIERHLQASEANQSPILGTWHSHELVALVGLKPESRPTVAHKASLWGLYVAPPHRRQGIGSRLLAFTITVAKEIEPLRQLRAVVNASSEEAIGLFVSSGFKQFGMEPRAKLVEGTFHDQVYFWYALDESG
jgi:ribosomal protein S18 acetylase RimI-like enzyme